ncbi:hypothetical protein D3C85_1020690 [compost metagenome]
MSSSMAARPSTGRVTPRAVSQISSMPSSAANVPRPNSSIELCRRAASSSPCNTCTGASSTLCGTLSNTPQAWLPAIGSKGSSTVMYWLSLKVLAWAWVSAARIFGAFSGATCCSGWPSFSGAWLLPAISPAGLRMLMWPLPP